MQIDGIVMSLSCTHSALLQVGLAWLSVGLLNSKAYMYSVFFDAVLVFTPPRLQFTHAVLEVVHHLLVCPAYVNASMPELLQSLYM